MEKAFIFGEAKNLVGIIHRPAHANIHYPVMIMINGGLIHRVGPNRLYVKLARTLGVAGWTSFRFDLSGLGDSATAWQQSESGNDVHDAKEAMDFIALTYGIHEFILMGICSGADVAFHTALKDTRVVGVIPINGYFYELEEMYDVVKKANEAVALRYYKKNMFSIARWQKIVRGRSSVLSLKNLSGILNSITNIAKQKFKPAAYAGSGVVRKNQPEFKIDNWDILLKRSTKLYHIFSEGSDAYDAFVLTAAMRLQSYIQSGKIGYTLIRDADHTCTLVWSQEYLIMLIKTWLLENNWEVTPHSSNIRVAEKESIQDLLMPNI